MKKQNVNYHDFDDSISFHFEYCNYLKSMKHSFSERTKKKLFFSKEKLSDQSEIRIKDIENKELLIFLEKTNNLKMILKRLSVKPNERLNERFKRLNERRLNESWKKELRKIEISATKILLKRSRKNSFFDDDYSIT